MRKITKDAAEAFRDGRKFCRSNTMVDTYLAGNYTVRRMYLHGNEIACLLNDELLVTLAGWPTVTTRERLNGLLQVLGIDAGFYQKDFAQWFEASDTHTMFEDHYRWFKFKRGVAT